MKINFKLLGIGQSVPINTLTNKDLQIINKKISPEWIFEKLGINSRRICHEGENVVSLGTNAAKEAINDAGWTIEEARGKIDLLIVNTSSSDRLSPSVACMIQNSLSLNCPAFDINAVCTGFIYALDIASSMLDRYENILIISTETYSKITDWEDRNCCFFGDGAASVIVSKGSGFIQTLLGAEGSGCEHFHCDREKTFSMNGKEVYSFGVNTLPNQINKLIQSTEYNIIDIDFLIPHQPSHKILFETATILNFPSTKVCFNMGEYANTAGASVPMALYKSIKNNLVEDGNLIILAAIGSGWTFGVSLIKLDYK